MAEKHTFKCPVCGGTMSADTESEAIRMAQKHAKENHQMDLSEDKARDMISREEEARGR